MGKRIRSYSGSYDYFFVKPSGRENVHKTAKRLMGIDRVREVSITEGDYGFIVKAEQIVDSEQDIIGKKIVKTIRGSSTKAVCYCQYVKE